MLSASRRVCSSRVEVFPESPILGPCSAVVLFTLSVATRYNVYAYATKRIFDSVKNGSPNHSKWFAGDGYTKYRLAPAMTERRCAISRAGCDPVVFGVAL